MHVNRVVLRQNGLLRICSEYLVGLGVIRCSNIKDYSLEGMQRKTEQGKPDKRRHLPWQLQLPFSCAYV